jgi:predicted PurR-regulated permease PerM
LENINTTFKIPLYAKVSQILLGIFIMFFILYIGQAIVIPILFAFIIAILLNPVVNYLCRRKVNRFAAILISIFLAIFCLAALLYFISSQVIMFCEMIPQHEEKINTLINQSINWMAQIFKVNAAKINVWLAQMKKEALSVGQSLIGVPLQNPIRIKNS